MLLIACLRLSTVRIYLRVFKCHNFTIPAESPVRKYCPHGETLIQVISEVCP